MYINICDYMRLFCALTILTQCILSKYDNRSRKTYVHKYMRLYAIAKMPGPTQATVKYSVDIPALFLPNDLIRYLC